MTNIQPYPCTRGTSTPMGWHNFQWSNGQAVCTYCGKANSTPDTNRQPHDYFGPYGVGRGGAPDA